MSNHAIQLETPQDYNTFSENNANNYFKCPSKSVRVFLAESFGMYLFILLSFKQFLAIYSYLFLGSIPLSIIFPLLYG